MRSFSLASGLVSSSQTGVMIGSHHAGDSTMVPKASRSWGGLSAAMGTLRPSAPACVPSMRRLTLPSASISGRFWKDEAVGLDGTFVRAGKEVCLFLCGMSDPRPDVTIDLSPGNPCRQRRKSPAFVDLVELHPRRLKRSASDLATNDQPVLGDLDGGEGRGGRFIKDLQTADELLPGAGENLVDRVVHTTRQRVVPRRLDRILERLVQEIERQIRVHRGIAVG